MTIDYAELKAKISPKATQSLFAEVGKNPDLAVFYLTLEPKEGLVSFKDVYIDLTKGDPTEYTLATEVFHGWKHWKRIKGNQLFNVYLADIVEERDKLIESDLVESVMEEAKHGKSRLPAIKYILERGWEKGGRGRRVGRPTSRASEEYSGFTSESLDEDFARIRS